MPLPVAFALAAVLSPTDPIAVSAVAARVPIPQAADAHPGRREPAERRLRPGLPALRRGGGADRQRSRFSSAALTFVWVALGGMALGVGVTWAVMWGKAGWCAAWARTRRPDPGQPADPLRRLSGGRAFPLLGHPGRRRRRRHHELCRDLRPGAGRHPHAPHGGVGHGAVRRQRHHLRPAGRATARHPGRRRQDGAADGTPRGLVAGGLCAADQSSAWPPCASPGSGPRCADPVPRGPAGRPAAQDRAGGWCWPCRWPACAAPSPWPAS
jgi:hypothetical protein